VKGPEPHRTLNPLLAVALAVGVTAAGAATAIVLASGELAGRIERIVRETR
jgi:hypothetical protein